MSHFVLLPFFVRCEVPSGTCACTCAHLSCSCEVQLFCENLFHQLLPQPLSSPLLGLRSLADGQVFLMHLERVLAFMPLVSYSSQLLFPLL